ncbi:MAG TPA: tetratricopeptide repeat protein [Gammaproteobacteria bacterium]|jgi:tetratricopeptide (TPR) repeat protein|nr:tetratricopeptide repeat protein [Gammaproteobacteria bacterium]
MTNQTTVFSEKLNTILTHLCHGIDIPQIDAKEDTHQAERLIEQVESQAYPHPLLTCEHQAEQGIGEDCVACQLLQYQTYQARFLALVNEKGYENSHTLKAAFDYYSTLITQYRLTECDELLDQIFSHCIARGSWSMYYVMAIQARAFLRFKQHRYQESIAYFHEQIDLLGPNEKIYENMALAYSRVNQLDEAAKCYARAILMIREKPLEEQKFATLFMGLSTVLENSEDALTVLAASMDILKQIYDKPHSLMAKTLSAMGDLHVKREEMSEALRCYAEAVKIFIDTCGLETPLTSTALNKYGKTLLQNQQNTEAQKVFIDALNVWVKLDDATFDGNLVLEALMIFMDKKNDEVLSVLPLLQNKILNNDKFRKDLNMLCLLKFVYQIYILNGKITEGYQSCKIFKENLVALDEKNLQELAPFREKLIKESEEILRLMETIKR